MTSKFKIEYYHKLPQTASPYLQLLEAKKKIFGYKYELIRNEKSMSQHNKSTGHANNQPSHKHSKTQSHEKEKPKSQKQNSRKKRSQTEQAEERLHESLFLNREEPPKEGRHQATKSLFTVEGNIDQSINPQQFMRNYRNLLDQDEKNIKSCTQQVESKGFSRERGPHFPSNSLQKLQVTEIDDLINLIDSCVQEANDYIGYLTDKIEALKNENSSMRQQQMKLIRMKDGIINEKQNQIDRLKKELHSHNNDKQEIDKSFEIKKLLEIINKISEENNTMKTRLRELETIQPRPAKESSEKEKKDIYNSIHNKIDILNISIDKKNHENSLLEPQVLREGKKSKNTRPKFYK